MKTHVIMLDIDGKLDLPRIALVASFFTLKVRDVFVCKTKHGYHVRLYLNGNNISDRLIVLIQALMGSDYKRECFNYERVMGNSKNWNILFEKKWKIVKGKMQTVSEEKFEPVLTEKLTNLLHLSNHTQDQRRIKLQKLL